MAPEEDTTEATHLLLSLLKKRLNAKVPLGQTSFFFLGPTGSGMSLPSSYHLLPEMILKSVAPCLSSSSTLCSSHPTKKLSLQFPRLVHFIAQPCYDLILIGPLQENLHC